jgi:hypothetical protein
MQEIFIFFFLFPFAARGLRAVLIILYYRWTAAAAVLLLPFKLLKRLVWGPQGGKKKTA